MRHGFPPISGRQRIGLLGGSFDPAHEGHVAITKAALHRFGLDRIWWLVTPGNPLKSHGPAPLAQRMIQARTIMSHPRVTITDLEETLGTQMTCDTIAALQQHFPRQSFTWLMGADNLAQFHLWTRWREIAQRVRIGVVARPGSRMAARLSPAARTLAAYRLPETQAVTLGRHAAPAWAMINLPMNDSSSTAIRAALRKSHASP